MSDPATALKGAAFEGLARVEEFGLRGMVTLKGNLNDPGFRKAAEDVAGVGLPEPGSVRLGDSRSLAWMAPDELMLFTAYDEADGAVAQLMSALDGTHFLSVNVSDARAVISLSGQGAREVLAKLTPADLDPSEFSLGSFRRTRIAQVPAAFWMPEETRIEIICFRSVADYVFDVLATAAVPGSSVDYF